MADVDVVDTPQEKVEVEALNGHPGEAAEQSVVQEGGQRRARSPGGRGQCRAQKEGDIQQQHRGVQVHVDAFYGVTLLPAEGSMAFHGLGTAPRQSRLWAHRCTVMGMLGWMGQGPDSSQWSARPSRSPGGKARCRAAAGWAGWRRGREYLA